MTYSHDYQVRVWGSCVCRCHEGVQPCVCGAAKITRLRPATGRKADKVQPFSRTKSRHRGESFRVISVMRQHTFHAENSH